MNSIKVGILGASGYTGVELLSYLVTHPAVTINYLGSRSYAGKSLNWVMPRFAQARCANIVFNDPTDESDLARLDVAVMFLALPHKVSQNFVPKLLEKGIKVIDLSADYRLQSADDYQKFYGDKHLQPELLQQSVYGLAELCEDVSKQQIIAAPGCYPTSILLPLVPLLKENLIAPQDIIIHSMSGVSGAGKTSNTVFSYGECVHSARAYNPTQHRHIAEIEQELSKAQSMPVTINFVPHLIPIFAGICSTIHVNLASQVTLGDINSCLQNYYDNSFFVRLLGATPADTKHVVGTNFIDIGWQINPRTRKLIIMSAIDNLGKGAAGQAVQLFNLQQQLPEQTGIERY